MSSSRTLTLLRLGTTYEEAKRQAQAEGFMTKEDIDARAQQLCLDDPDINYAKLIRDVCATAFDGQGITYDEVRIGSEISEAIAKVAAIDGEAQQLTLTDAQYNFFIERLKRFRWRVAHPNVVRFLNDVRDAKPPKA